MKRGTIDHPKMDMLAAELRIPKPYAVGILETLWHWAPRFAIQGDIGKWPDASIAKGTGWDGPAENFIDALVKSGWIDRVDGPARLVIHDVQDHADNTWKQNLEDAGLRWWDGSRPRMKGQGKRPDLKPKKDKKKSTSRQLQDNLQDTSRALPQPEPGARSQEPKPEEKSPPPARASTVKEILEEFKKLPAYSHINVQVEADKMQAWKTIPKNRHRTINRRFILNWINKIEKPLEITKPPPDRPKPEVLTRPPPTPQELEANAIRAREARKLFESVKLKGMPGVKT